MNSLISIIIPVYNVDPYLNRCLKSIRLQTYQHIEIILVDDGSTDKSAEICDAFAFDDKRSTVIHKLNGGLSSARNAGLEIANGDFVAFVDADDFVDLDMYEKLLLACTDNSAAISMCAFCYYFSEGKKWIKDKSSKMVIWSAEEAIGNLLLWNRIDSSACNKLFRKELFSDMRFPEGKICEDVSIIPKIICRSSKMVHIGEAKYYYYQRAGSITHSDFSLNRFNMLDAHKEISLFVKSNFPQLKNKAEHFYIHALVCLYVDFYSSKDREVFLYLKDRIDYLAKRKFISIVLSRYLDHRTKGFFLLIFLKVYPMIRFCKNQIKLFTIQLSKKATA